MLTRATGNPVDLLLPPDAPPEARTKLANTLGLDQPYPVQFFHFVANVIRGDFGKSILTRLPATEMFFNRLVNTIKLAAVAMAIVFLTAFPLGVIAAVKKGRWIDSLASFIAAIGMGAPAFWIGIVLIFLVSVKAGLLPVAGMGSPAHYILPAFTLALFFIAGIARLLRSSMLEVLDSDFVKMARIKGVSERAIVWKHCLRNALIPVLSMSALFLGALIGGSMVVETVFAWPGVGLLAYEAVVFRDFPVIQAIVMIEAFFILLINLATDILYVWVDPRIRYD